MSFLSATGMTGGYGGADIIHDCTITVEQGEIAVVVGPNGAGKSTAMKDLRCQRQNFVLLQVCTACLGYLAAAKRTCGGRMHYHPG